MSKMRERLLSNKASQSCSEDKSNNKMTMLFEYEFNNAKIPFSDIIKDGFKLELFRQYENAEIKPSFHLYLADFYSEDEINKGFEEVYKRLPESKSGANVSANFISATPFESRLQDINREFNEKIFGKELPLKYFCPNIDRTAIVQTLREIKNKYDVFQKVSF